MSGMGVLGLSATNPNPQYKEVTHKHPYTSSASSASSSSSSIFSLDGTSSHGSTSTAATSFADVTLENDGKAARRGPISTNEANFHRPIKIVSESTTGATNTIAPELCRHPRRTNSFVAQTNGTSCPRAPPILMRQSERKVSFVDNLVDTASQIVEIIWPLSSTVSLRSDTGPGCKNVLPLRTFIQETLRRSRTSYSTLQVALYYLIKIKPHVPSQDLIKDQHKDKPICRAIQCGRRMFLAALILASKYLQDRNYSARAWSKISGLNTAEINRNELMFLGAVDWRLHIPDATFQRWTDLVLRYTPGAGGPPVGYGHSWRTIIPKLTPALDCIEVDGRPPSSPNTRASESSVLDSSASHGIFACNLTHLSCPYVLSPSLARSLPATLEVPISSRLECPNPPLPPLPRISMLPTPQMTPHPCAASTPAASGDCRGLHRPQQVLATMSEAPGACMPRSTLDQRPLPILYAKTGPVDSYPAVTRRSSLARSSSSASSPDSMVSDMSSLSNSSQSSLASSSALGNFPRSQPQFPAKAVFHCAEPPKGENGKPLTIACSNDEGSLSDIYNSPESYTGPAGQVPDLSNFSLETPAGLSSTHEAAQSLCELSGSIRVQHNSSASTVLRGCRKRCRTSSEDMLLQSRVRYLIDLGANTEEPVHPDSRQAKSFLIPEPTGLQCAVTGKPVQLVRMCDLSSQLSGPAGMKRACCGSEARKIALNPTMRAEHLS